MVIWDIGYEGGYEGDAGTVQERLQVEGGRIIGGVKDQIADQYQSRHQSDQELQIGQK